MAAQVAEQAYVPISVHSVHHRVATPITPIHSPHQSLSSTPSRTPVHSLTLHEYRKQQNTPSPQSITPGKRLRRKLAASGLNTIERIPSVPETRVRPSSPSFSSQQRPNLPTSTKPLPRSPSFISLPTISHHQPSESSSASALIDQGGTQVDYPSTKEAEGFYRSHEQFSNFQNVRTFKPIKRLPKPLSFAPILKSGGGSGTGGSGQFLNSFGRSSSVFVNSNPLALPLVPSPLRSSSSTENLVSSAGLTTTSTVSLSRFPQPPQLEGATPLDRENDSPPHVNISIATTAPVTPPATPAVLHYRGASFDLVNPHHSLYLHDIETPADRDAELAEYFQDRPSTELLRGAEIHQLQSTSSHNGPRSVKSNDTMSQRRALFDDLPSAYTSIRGPNRPFHMEPSVSMNLPLPPTPVAFHSVSPHYETPAQERLPQYVPAPLRISKSEPRPTPSPTFMQRLSRRFTGKRRQPASTPTVVSEELQEISPPRKSQVYGRPLSHSAPTVTMGQEREVEVARDGEASMSEADLGSPGYYDTESIYPSSMVGGDDRNSIYSQDLYNRRSVHNRPNVPFGVKVAETDYSSEADIHSYSYQFGSSAQSSRHMSRGRMDQEFFRHPDVPEQTDTISKIIDGYNADGADVTETSLIDLMDDEEDEDTIRISGIPTERRSLSQKDLLPRASGFSQFDFDLRRDDSSPGSSVSGPKTPEYGVQFPRYPGFYRSTVGSPPRVPLPLQPPIELEEPRPTFPRREYSSQILSEGSSYGRTRDLLYLSQSFDSSSIPRIQEPGQETSRASSSVLPHLGDREVAQTSSEDSSGTRVKNPSVDRIFESQVNRLSQISAKSNLSGNFIIVSSTGTAGPCDEQGVAGSGNPMTPTAPGRPLEPFSSYSQDDGYTTPPKALAQAEKIFVETSNDRQTSSGIPKMWRELSPIRRKEPSERTSPSKDSYADFQDEEDDRDWETVGNPSRPNFPRPSMEDSIADYSSNGGSFTNTPNTIVHPADDRYSHTYKLSRSESGDSVLLPSYNFRDGAGFPNRNAVSTPRLASTPYRHPSPLPAHPHPFHSSPPQLSMKSKSSYSAFALDHADQRSSPAGIGAVVEIDGPHPRPPTRLSRNHPDGYRPVPNPYEMNHRDEMEMLSSGPNDNIIYEDEDGHSANIGDSMNDLGDLEDMADSMRAEPPTMSSLATERDNSFEKLTILGPKGNLTGTPQGTGMQEVGSSLADSSSPGAAWDSTPSRVPGSSPERYFHSSPETQYASSRVTQFPTSQFTPFGTVEQGTPGHSPHASKNSDFTPDGILLAHRRQLTREGLLRAHHESHRSRSRPSVRGQTKLREMVLNTPDTATIASLETRITRFMSADRAGSEDTTSPLRSPRHTPGVLPSENSPHLLGVNRSSTAILRKRKQRLSWILFAMLAWFPPFLVVYAYGGMDQMIAHMSDGQVEECGRLQKRIAKWVGVIGTLVIPIAAVLILTLVHFGVI